MRGEASCLVDYLSRALTEVLDSPETQRYAVAHSGGLDSSVLLLAMSRLNDRWRGARLRAIHVNHRLHPDSSTWAERSETVSREIGVPITVLPIDTPVSGSQGLEAEARTARYRAFESELADGEILLSAHHGDDQLETFLLQMLRGSGPAGLAAMPSRKPLGFGYLVRPLLGLSRDELEAWALAQNLEWIEDPSNEDDRHARNYLRHHVTPTLLDRWPAARDSATRSAALCAEANELLEQVGRLDIATALGDDKTLCLSTLLDLPDTRLRNALRVWVADSGFAVPGYAKLHEICHQIRNASVDSSPCLRWDGAELRRYRQRLYLCAPLASPPLGTIDWRLTQGLVLPGGLGKLSLADAADERPGLADKHLSDVATVRFREGGEAFRPVNAQSCPLKSRPLKKWLQEQGIPPWQRKRWPLVYLGEELAWVPGLGPASQFAAGPGEKARVVHWQAADAVHSVDHD